MKKFLLSLAAVALSTTALFADITDVFGTTGFNPALPTAEAENVSTTSDNGVKYVLNNCKKSSNYLQISGKNFSGANMEITLPIACSKITVTTSSVGSKNVIVQFAANGTNIGDPVTLNEQSAEFSFDIPTAQQAAGTKYTLTTTNKYNAQFTQIVYTEAGAAGEVVPTPEITLANGMATIVAPGADAIYYTVDGTAPTAASTKYTAPFAAAAGTTIKAVAEKNGKLGTVVTLNVPAEYADLAAFVAGKPATAAKINGPISVLYQNGLNTYLKDGKGNYLLSYNSNKVEMTGLKNGSILESITGTFKDQNSLPEIIPTAVGKATDGATIEPETITIEELSTDMLNAYVRIEGVAITDVNNRNFNLTDETGTIAGYNTFIAPNYDPVTIEAGENFTVIGFVSCYKTTLQITPVSIQGGEVMETVATPTFSTDSRTVEAGTKVELATATRGATIFYTIDGTDPSAASTEYTGAITINEAVTIKAIAVKEGMLDSEIAIAKFTIFDPSVTSAKFDFENLDGFTPAIETPAQSAGTNVTGLTYTAGGVTMAFSGKESSNTDPRIWNSQGVCDLRLYNTQYFTLTVPAGYALKSITLTTKANLPFTVSAGTLGAVTDGTAVWTPAVAAEIMPMAEGDASIAEVKFTATATARISSVEVEYSNSDAVQDIAADNIDAAPEYYNLQGVRVSEPTPGLYIVKCGNKVSKTVIR